MASLGGLRYSSDRNGACGGGRAEHKEKAGLQRFPQTDHMIGPDQIACFIAGEMHRLFSQIEISFRGIHADGDTVTVEERMRATLPGGRPYDNDYCHCCE
jgi:hypothetical protein